MPLPTTDEDALVAFFEALPTAARRAYEALAERDRTFGEDVEAEARRRREEEAS